MGMEYLFYYIPQHQTKSWVNANKAKKISVTTQLSFSLKKVPTTTHRNNQFKLFKLFKLLVNQ